MPYTKDTLPEKVKELPADKQDQWLAVFNSALESCEKEGGENCEEAAFAQAWGVVNKAEENAQEDPPVEDSKLKKLLAGLEELFKKIFGGDSEEDPPEEDPPVDQDRFAVTTKERSVSFPAIYDQVYIQLQGADPVAMMYDIYYDDIGLFAIVASNGKLFKVPVMIKDGTVSLGKWEEIAVTQGRKPSFRIERVRDGKYRWVSISATSVLNRSGEIDSRELFDNLIKRAEESGQYPIRVFYHAGAKFRTGQCDFLGRDDNVLVTSGLYDNTELAMREINARLQEPEYWGDSISFYPMAPAETIRANDATIPVYTDGILEEISTLPEQDAASWMTATPNIVEVKRMLNQRQMNAFVKLFGDEEAAKKWLEENAATRNRTIVDEGMITRARRELAAIVEGQEPPVEVPTATTDSESMISQIVEQVVARMNIPEAVSSAMQPLSESITSIVSRVDALEKQLTAADSQTKTIAQALTRLDKTDAQKKRDWLNDLPVKPTTEPTYRPREQRAADHDKTGDEAAKEVLDRIPTY